MCGVEKLEAPVFDERHVAAGELERGAVVGAAKQHRLAFKQSARFAIGEHSGCDEARLVSVVGDGDQHGKRAMRLGSAKGLGEALGRESDHRIGGGKDSAT